MGVAMSLRDGSINLSNSWTRQLSETAHGNVIFFLEFDYEVDVDWKIGSMLLDNCTFSDNTFHSIFWHDKSRKQSRK